jgi:hypothetical protein
MITYVTSAQGPYLGDADTITCGTFNSGSSTPDSLIVVIRSSYEGVAKPTPTDNMGNTYVACGAEYSVTGDPTTRLYYNIGGTRGAGHTVTITQVGSFPTVVAAVFTGLASSSPCDQTNGAGISGTATGSTGPITPTQPNELIISGGAFTANNALAVDSGLTIIQETGGGAAIAYLIQTAATTINATWNSGAGTTAKAILIASFKAAPAGGSVRRNSALNGLGSSGRFFHDPLSTRGYRYSPQSRLYLRERT